MRTYIEKSGCEALDNLIGGGFSKKMVTQFYGEPGGGKSTFCMIAAVNVLLSGRAVVYVDTESFSIERFRQIAGENAEVLSEKLYLFEPSDFDQQAVMISEVAHILKNRDVGLVILDSATGLYRTELEHGPDTLQKLNRQMVKLLGFAKKYDLPVIITNQVYMDLPSSDFSPLGGTGLMHLSKVIVRIERLQNQIRRTTLTKHNSRPEGGFFDFITTEQGVKVCGKIKASEP